MDLPPDAESLYADYTSACDAYAKGKNPAMRLWIVGAKARFLDKLTALVNSR